MRMFTTPTIHNQSVMFSDCSLQSHPLNSKSPLKSRGIFAGIAAARERKSPRPCITWAAVFSGRRQGIWFTLPEFLLLPPLTSSCHASRSWPTGWLYTKKQSTGREVEGSLGNASHFHSEGPITQLTWSQLKSCFIMELDESQADSE